MTRARDVADRAIVADAVGATELDETDNYAFTGTVTGAGGGKVLNVVYQELTSVFSTSSTSFVDIGLSASITPSSASNYLLITPNVNINHSNSGSYAFLDLTDSSNNSVVNHTDALSNRTKAFAQTAGYGGTIGIKTIENYSPTFKISPATTSAVTYKVRARVNTSTARINATGSDTDNVSHVRTISSLTIMEIEG